MTRRIAVFTGTRAEYGLLYWLMKDIAAHPALELELIVSGMHLSPEFGSTWREIVADGFTIDERVEILLSSDTPVGIAKSTGLATMGCAEALDRLRPDAIVILGDRFEALAAAQAALILRIPVVHLHGGEATEGAIDDSIRHAITKMASLHFTATEPYRRRVIQMGEADDTVFDVGALGIDHLHRSAAMPMAEVCESLNFHLRPPYFLATYHPVTAGEEDAVATTDAMLDALDGYPEHQVVLTYPNADTGGRAIIPLLIDYVRRHPDRAVAVPSLGFRRYLTVLRNAAAVVGNSSSGIIEAPSFGVPTIDIGGRQRGRIAAASVIHCDVDRDSISEALGRALSPEFAEAARRVDNPYGTGDAAARIVEIIADRPLPTLKRFCDLEFSS
ncbi:UDP-N-acetyl glucosamine 2-epimerase [Sphingomonas sp. Leaf412]|uniref:UDP-N-acetylglucosamine 2-epimerase n=1 Tax=Sphingomonas sp. Leaf412 TaxID=1736370 RepID=UPI0006F2C84E|nr:UDP-N-acetylglucosamine 2-epimerase [Sphingomonas sp. Leaf412]KQT31162.1 UDP-N-acetyl glucosamine 2-epimerase [Sphingomonas sp. Leaf412]